MRKWIFLLLVVLSAPPLLAKELGERGQVFPIKEPSFLSFIQSKLANLKATGALSDYEDRVKKRVASEINHPSALPLIPEFETKVHYVDPSIRLNKDITDQTGRILVHSGTIVNPFNTVHLKEVLIFFNGDDQSQVHWVHAHYQDYRWVKFILTGGNLKNMANQFGRIYRDQNGLITSKLNIKHIPAIAMQKDKRWKITTIGLKDLEK